MCRVFLAQYIAAISIIGLLSPTAVSQQTPEAQSKYMKYAAALIKQYDEDNDGKLSKDETKKMRRPPTAADLNNDGWITKAELIDNVSRRKNSSSKKETRNIDDLSQARSLLQANGISVDSSSVVAHLKRQLPDEDLRPEIAKLIRQLGHARFDQRTEASAKLATLGITAKPQLQIAAQSDSPEVVSRARKLLQQLGSRADSSLRAALLVAALIVLKEEPAVDTVPVLFALEEAGSTTACDDLVKETIWAATNSSHAPLLRKALDHDNLRVRSAAELRWK